jgi:hypothetical protein
MFIEPDCEAIAPQRGAMCVALLVSLTERDDNIAPRWGAVCACALVYIHCTPLGCDLPRC